MQMEPFHIRAVIFQEGDVWIMQGIEHDIVAHAGHPVELHEAFMRAVAENLCISRYLGREPLDGIGPAPSRFLELFEQAPLDIRTNSASPDFPAIDARLVSAAAH